MSGTSTPEETASEAPGDGQSPPRSSRRLLSILGLAIVTGLNVASLAFIAYHLAAHSQKSPAASAGYAGTSEAPMVDAPGSMQATLPTAPDVSGNVDLAATSMNVISVASGFDLTDEKPATHQESVSLTSVEHGGSVGAVSTSAGASPDHWVQLGALSKEATARRYWSDLKLRYASLLQESEPRYLGPSEVGGSLFHIRLGPMAADAAHGLCERLEAEGADCFSVSPVNDHS